MLFLTDLGAEDPDKIFESGVCLKECPPQSDSPLTVSTPSVEGGTMVLKTTYYPKIVLSYCFPDFAADPDCPHGQNWKEALERFTDNPAGAKFTDFYLSSRAIYTSMVLAPIYVCLFVLLLSKFAH